MAPRALLLRLVDHPGPATVALQRRTMLALIATAFALVRIGRHLSR